MSAAPEEQIDDAGVVTRAFNDLLDDLQALDGAERREALSEWVRSPWFSPCGFLLDDWQGALHREAWRYLQDDLEAPTPGKAWQNADCRAGRATIARLLGAEGWQHSFYATFPFRIMWTQEDEPWIGGAVGCLPLLDVEKLKAWEHIDIRYVILWNPKTGETRLHGEAPRNSHLVLPEVMPDRLEVFDDTLAFFSAWARRRAGYASLKLHDLPENADGHLPGALVIGGIDKVRFPQHAAATLVAQPPLSRAALRKAVLRSANLPKVEEVGGARV